MGMVAEDRNPMIIAVDFDGTVVEHRYPDIGKAVPGALDWLKRFAAKGAKIILFTMRSVNQEGGRDHLAEAVTFLTSNGVELFGVNTNPTQTSWTQSPKAYAHLYIDDAAVGCPLIASSTRVGDLWLTGALSVPQS